MRPVPPGTPLVVTAAQRRARLVARHRLAEPAGTVEEAVETVVCLHATEPASVHLAVAARTRLGRGAVERALYADRSVVKQLAMRRTLFAFPADLLPHVWGSASARVAAQVRARLALEVEANGIAPDGAAWVERTSAAVVEALAAGPATTAQLRERVPDLARRLDMHADKAYGGNFPVAPRLMTVLAAGGEVLRGENDGGWRTSRPRWTLTEQWLEAVPPPRPAAEGYAELVRRWLRSFGPGTTDDLTWWLGATKGAVRAALAAVGAVEVLLEPDPGTPGASATPGWVLPEDLDGLATASDGDPDSDADVPGAASLLPVLDPTAMGWKQRDFYLRPEHVPHLVDRNGNIGTTAWWRGRAVGCWVQDPDGRVRVVVLRDPVDPGEEAVAALEVEAERLSAWLDGEVVSTVYPSPLVRASRGD